MKKKAERREAISLLSESNRVGLTGVEDRIKCRATERATDGPTDRLAD